MASNDGSALPPHGAEFRDAILEYHWKSRESNQKAQALYQRAVTFSDRFWDANAALLDQQDWVFLKLSDDHTSVFTFIGEHQSGLPMMRWCVCKPLGGAWALPRSRREGSESIVHEKNPSNDGTFLWGPELYAAAMQHFWHIGDDAEEERLRSEAVAISDRFLDSNRPTLDSQEWVLLSQGIHELILLVSLDKFSETERHMIWAPAKVEAWYGALPRSLRSSDAPWVHQIAYNELSH